MSEAARETSCDWTVTGMDCGSCATKIKDAVARLPGVSGVEGGIMSERLRLTLDEGQTAKDRIEKTVRALGYEIAPRTASAKKEFVLPGAQAVADTTDAHPDLDHANRDHAGHDHAGHDQRHADQRRRVQALTKDKPSHQRDQRDTSRLHRRLQPVGVDRRGQHSEAGGRVTPTQVISWCIRDAVDTVRASGMRGSLQTLSSPHASTAITLDDCRLNIDVVARRLPAAALSDLGLVSRPA